MADIKTYYEQYWDAPEEYTDSTGPLREALLRKHVGHLPRGSRVLDVGCGRGEFVAFFKSMGFEAEGIDLSEAGIRYARERFPGMTFHAGETDVLLPQKAGWYDLLFSSEVIEHLFDVPAYLHACNALLKPGGLLVLTTPYHGLVKNLLLDVLNYGKHYDPLGQHIRFFDTASLGLCLRRWGFEPTVWSGYGRPWPLYKSFFVVSRKAAESPGPRFSGSNAGNVASFKADGTA